MLVLRRLPGVLPPLAAGVCFNGRQAPGGHNVIAGLHDQLKALNPESELLGFVGGSRGLFAGRTLTITDEVLGLFRQQGGYHLLGRSVDKIRSEKEQAAALATANALALDGLLLIGGACAECCGRSARQPFSKYRRLPQVESLFTPWRVHV